MIGGQRQTFAALFGSGSEEVPPDWAGRRVFLLKEAGGTILLAFQGVSWCSGSPLFVAGFSLGNDGNIPSEYVREVNAFALLTGEGREVTVAAIRIAEVADNRVIFERDPPARTNCATFQPSLIERCGFPSAGDTLPCGFSFHPHAF